MSRANLIRYQDTYAEQMAAYGLQRGIKGSEAQHISTHECNSTGDKGREAKLVLTYQRDTHCPMVYGAIWDRAK